MRKTVLVTGGNGFIGRRLTDALLKEGYQVRIVSRSEPKHKPVNPHVQIVKADYQNCASLQRAMEGCSMVYHLAAAIFGYCYEDFAKANARATQNMVHAANLTPNLERFVYVSSQAAAGYSTDPDKPLTEDMAPQPVSDYGITKLAGEKAVQTLRPSIKWTIVRPPIVYGKNDSGVSKIAAWVKRGLMVNTSGKGLFSFVYVDDLVEALTTVPKIQGTEGQIFFICEEKNYPWPEFIEKMAKAMGVKKPIMPRAPLWALKLAAALYSLSARIMGVQPALNYDKVKEASIRGHWICSSEKWRSLTKQVFTPLDEGLKNSF